MTLRATTADQVQAIHVRQPEIDDKAVVNLLAGQGQRGFRVLRGVHLIAGLAKATVQEVTDCGSCSTTRSRTVSSCNKNWRWRRIELVCITPYVKYPSCGLEGQALLPQD